MTVSSNNPSVSIQEKHPHHQVNINTESFKRRTVLSLMGFGSLHRQIHVSSKAVTFSEKHHCPYSYVVSTEHAA